MKWILLILILTTAPIVGVWLRSNPRKAPLVWGLLGFLPFVTGPWHLLVAPYSTAMWPGYVKGWEVSFLDTIAVGILYATHGRRQKMTLVVPFLAYIFAVTIAIYQAQFSKLAFSYVFQLIRMFILFLAVSRVVVSERGAKAVCTGLVAGLAVQAVYALIARAGGALQTGGSFGHQNLLGFVSHMVIMPAFALFLAGRWQKIAIPGLVTGIIVVILTASRATIAFSGAGLALTWLLSMVINFTGRKAALGALGLVVLAASFPIAKGSLDRRFHQQQATFFTEDMEREAFSKAAHAMLNDYPWGVGPNHYVLIANTQGYSARAGVAWRSASRGTNVHNSYLLAAVETGYFGLFTLLGLLAAAIWYAFTTAFRFRREPGSELLIGVGCGIIAMSIHGLYEWMLVVYPTQYIFFISLGLIGGLRARFFRTARQRAAERPSRRANASNARMGSSSARPELGGIAG